MKFQDAQVYRAGRTQYLAATGLAGFFFVMTAVVASTRDRVAWRLIPGYVVLAILWMLTLVRARLVITPDRIVYSSLWRKATVARRGVQRIGWATNTKLFESRIYPRFQVLGKDGVDLRIRHRLFPRAALKHLIAWAGSDLQGGDGEEEIVRGSAGRRAPG